MSDLTFQQLREANKQRQQEWDSDGKTNTLLYRAVELGGEAGEVLNVAKKLERERLGVRGSRSNLEALAEELADVVICANLLAEVEGIDLGAAVVAKFNATSEKIGLSTRLPDGSGERFVVIEDYGDNWLQGEVAFGPFRTIEEAYQVAEDNNYHSASIVRVVDGVREAQVGP